MIIVLPKDHDIEHLVSISSTFYEQLLRAQIPKVKRRLTLWLSLCTFGIWTQKSSLQNVDEIDPRTAWWDGSTQICSRKDLDLQSYRARSTSFFPGTNFTNILQEAFFTTFMCFQFGLVIFQLKNFGTKGAGQMLVILTNGSNFANIYKKLFNMTVFCSALMCLHFLLKHLRVWRKCQVRVFQIVK